MMEIYIMIIIWIERSVFADKYDIYKALQFKDTCNLIKIIGNYFAHKLLYNLTFVIL